jgi:hypothetical protein
MACLNPKDFLGCYYVATDFLALVLRLVVGEVLVVMTEEFCDILDDLSLFLVEGMS